MTRPVILIIAWFVGLALAAWRMPPWPLPGLAVLAAGLLCLLQPPFPKINLTFFGWRLGRLDLPLLSPCLLALAAGVAWLSLADYRPQAERWLPLYGRELVVVGRVDEDPGRRDNNLSLRVTVETIALVPDGDIVFATGQWTGQAAPGVDWILGFLRPAPAVQARVASTTLARYGDRVQMRGKLVAAPVYEDFAYRDFLARRGVFGLIWYPSVRTLATGQGAPLQQFALDLRARADQTITDLLPGRPDEAALLSGVLLGLDDRLSPEVMEAFRATSVSHIVVVSGFNITILVGFLDVLARVVRLTLAGLAGLALTPRTAPLRQAAMFGLRRTLITSRSQVVVKLAVIAFYVVLVGGSPSAARAALMGGFVVLAVFLGRPSAVLTALACSAWVISFVQPWAILDIGFQLSFAGTLGLVVLGRALEAEVAAWRPRLVRSSIVTEGLWATLAATLVVSPLISYYFSQVSLIGLLANLAILPAQPPLMLLGGAATLVGGVWPELGHVLASLAWLPLAWSIGAAQWFARAPWAVLDIRATLSQVILAYGLIGCLFVVLSLRRQARRRGSTPGLQQADTGQPDARPSWRLQSGTALAERAGRLGGRSAAAPARATADPPPRQRFPLHRWLGLGLALVVIGWGGWGLGAGRADGLLRLTILSSGDTVIVRTPAGDRLVIGGSSRTEDTAVAVAGAGPLWDRQIALVALSRPDVAHVEGLSLLLRRYHVGRVLWPGPLSPATEEAWRRGADAATIPVILAPGERLNLAGEVDLDLLALDERGGALYRLAYGQARILLAGGVRQAVTLPPGEVHVLLVGQRLGEEAARALAASQPALTIVHADGGTGQSLPGQDSLTVAERGEIRLATDGARVWWDSAR